ncbi:hypothetical protein M0R45_008529 [Rubus argutus]|uniref:START domain-containing protein n=1 Tax=Rubus argutus TaxID=59490 RepID=A0AAW1Y117_RUBAR
MVTNAKTFEVLSRGEEENYKKQKQVMSVEFLVATSNVPTREVQFIRYSHQQLDGSLIVVDVSVDELQSIPRPSVRSICRRRLSECLIRDLQNGYSFVTWMENIDVREKEKELHAKFKHFVESGFAFGAQRWMSTLQRQAERFLYSMGINTSLGGTVITAEGRRSLATVTNKMMVSFCNNICNSPHHHLSTSNKTRGRPMEVKTNKRRDDPDKPSGLNRTAGCIVLHLSQHTRISDFLRDAQKRHLWENMSMNSSVHVLANVTIGLDPRNCISVLAISSHNDVLIFQECCDYL